MRFFQKRVSLSTSAAGQSASSQDTPAKGTPTPSKSSLSSGSGYSADISSLETKSSHIGQFRQVRFFLFWRTFAGCLWRKSALGEKSQKNPKYVFLDPKENLSKNFLASDSTQPRSSTSGTSSQRSAVKCVLCLNNLVANIINFCTTYFVATAV